MDFITDFLRTYRFHDSIMVFMDFLIEVAHFIPMMSTYSTNDVAHVFIKYVVRLHRVLKKIVTNRDTKFISRF